MKVARCPRAKLIVRVCVCVAAWTIEGLHECVLCGGACTHDYLVHARLHDCVMGMHAKLRTCVADWVQKYVSECVGANFARLTRFARFAPPSFAHVCVCVRECVSDCVRYMCACLPVSVHDH